MAQIQVNSATLRNKKNQLVQYNQSLKGQIQNLDNYANQLKGMWEGEAKNVFYNYYNKNVSMFNDFINLVTQYANVLEEAAAEYDRREAQNAQTATTT